MSNNTEFSEETVELVGEEIHFTEEEIEIRGEDAEIRIH